MSQILPEVVMTMDYTNQINDYYNGLKAANGVPQMRTGKEPDWLS